MKTVNISNFKKTFWMNVIGSLGWLILSPILLRNRLAEVGVIKHLTLYLFLNLCVIAMPIITALSLYFSGNQLLRKLGLFANYCGIISVIAYIFALAVYYPSVYASFDVIAVFITMLMFAVPCLINLKALRKFNNSLS
jgi:hypothetical protein